MPRVLLFCEYATLNGGERSMLATLPGLIAGGWEMIVATPPGPLGEELSRLAVPHRVWHPMNEIGRRFPLQKLREEVARHINDCRPDLVHANSLSMARVIGPVAGPVCGVPSIGHVRDIVGMSQSVMADVNCNSRLLAVSKATRDFHVAAGMDAPRTHVVYNGVDLSHYCPGPRQGMLQRDLKLPADARLVLSIGQIGMRKGLDVLLQAMARVISQRPDVHLAIVGQRHSEKDEAVQYEKQLHTRAAAPALRGHIHFLGRSDDVPQMLCEAHLLVHAARQEPLGRVLLEAAATGTPVVATDAGGTREIFLERHFDESDPAGQYAAWIVPPDDPDALAGGMAQLLDNETLRQQLGRRARQIAEERFSADMATTALARHYAEVASEAERSCE